MAVMTYLSYVLRHKWYVFWGCWYYGLIWRGLVHDLSKLRPSEFGPYKRFFYGKKNPRGGYMKPTDTGVEEFEVAWLHHQRRNKHHPEYWCYMNNNDQWVTHEMPEKYRKEMVADWYGAHKAQRANGTIRDWYLANKDKLHLAPETRMWVEAELDTRFAPKSAAERIDTPPIPPNTLDELVEQTGTGDFQAQTMYCENTAAKVLGVCAKFHKAYYTQSYRGAGYDNFVSYVEARTQVKASKAVRMIAIYQWFLKLPVPVREQVQALPWEKVSPVVGLLTKDNAAVWLPKMRDCSVAELSREVRNA